VSGRVGEGEIGRRGAGETKGKLGIEEEVRGKWSGSDGETNEKEKMGRLK